MLIAGVDPGSKGAIAVINGAFEIQDLIFSAKPTDIRDIWKKYRGYDFFVFIEEVHAIFGSSAKSTFGFGRNFGSIMGALEALNIGYDFVPPKTWQYKYHKKHMKIKDPKERSLKAATALYPKVSFRHNERLHDGIVDALLIATYGVEEGSK